MQLLTANEHDTDGENLLRVGVWRDIPKAHAGQTTEGEIERSDVFILNGGSWAGITVVVMFPQLISQVIQPTCLHVGPLHMTNGIPDAGQPMSNQHEGAH